MAKSTPTAPRGTRALIGAIMAALEAIPEATRKAAFRHASVTVREKLTVAAAKTKLAAKRAPARGAAKRVVATRRPRQKRAALS